jgi:cobyrinic acid a,c-diamide synthase
MKRNPLTSKTRLIPSLLIAGTHSGVGKTTVSFAIMSLLSSRGFNVQPFKIGPDFIDPGYHRLATGHESINLDLWMMGLRNVRESFAYFAEPADVAVIEGMGALYDGENGVSERGSAGYMARQLGVPVLLVIDIWGITRSTNAVINGFMNFDPRVQIAGIILNRAGGRIHYEMVLNSLPSRTRKLVIGYLPRSKDWFVPERHLGLLTLDENSEAINVQQKLLAVARETIDCERLIRLFKMKKKSRPKQIAINRDVDLKRVKIGIAKDKAFCFYYTENLRMLEEAGAELHFFSPIDDETLPADVSGLYIGGGYPESFAADLANNKVMRQQILRSVRAGMPVYAECGGLMYLGRTLTNFDGRKHAMVSALPLDTRMDKDFLAIKYVTVETNADTPLGPSGTKMRGHEFHQSRLTLSGQPNNSYRVESSRGEVFAEGFTRSNLLASYIHIHFKSNPNIPKHLISECLKYRMHQRR